MLMPKMKSEPKPELLFSIDFSNFHFQAVVETYYFVRLIPDLLRILCIGQWCVEEAFGNRWGSCAHARSAQRAHVQD